MYVHMYMPDACGGHKRVLDLLELKVWMVVSHRVRTENQTWILWKSHWCPYCLADSSPDSVDV